jgi:TusA-related sulfurtransferase
MHDTIRELDTRGLNCPLPILKAKKALPTWPAANC